MIAAAISGLTWWSSRRSASAAEDSASQAGRSADAAERSAAAAEEGVEPTRAEHEAQREAARTPRFELGRIDWRGGTLAASAPIRMMSSEPAVREVEVTVMGATELGVYGSDVRGAPSLWWDRPVQLEPFAVTFERPTVDQPVTLTLRCTLGGEEDGQVKVVELVVSPARNR